MKHDSSKREEVTIEEETDERSEPFRMNNNNNQNGARGVSHDELQFPILPQTVDAHGMFLPILKRQLQQVPEACHRSNEARMLFMS